MFQFQIRGHCELHSYRIDSDQEKEDTLHSDQFHPDAVLTRTTCLVLKEVTEHVIWESVDIKKEIHGSK